jgi:hypothetical protein
LLPPPKSPANTGLFKSSLIREAVLDGESIEKLRLCVNQKKNYEFLLLNPTNKETENLILSSETCVKGLPENYIL